MSRLGLTLQQIVELIEGSSVVGDSGFLCESVAPLQLAGENDLSFVRDSKAEKLAKRSRAGALVVREALDDVNACQLVVPDVMTAMIRVLERIGSKKRLQPIGVDPRAMVDDDADLGADVVIGPGAVVSKGAAIGDRAVIYGNAYVGLRSRIGEDSIIHPNVTIMEDVTIGKRTIIHGGTVIGSDGYGFVPHQGKQVKVPQVGEVVIGDDVEIGACSTIDRATIARTLIGNGTKIGDLVHVAHNVEIGEDVLLLPTVAISGSTKMGNRVIFAGRAACSGHLKIGDDAVLGAAAIAFKDVEQGAVLWGNPARDKTTEMRIQSILPKLPEMAKEIRRLRRAITEDE
jgi:UDP-3-O-[3-hydroxymyristoyl] glucosamine N-acyltransferase